MIFIKKCEFLTNAETQQINNLILSCFENSRLSTYDTVICYEESRHIIGCIGYHTKTSGPMTILNQLCVSKEYRNRGIATELLKYTEDTQKKPLILYIDKHEDDTQRLYDFYKKRGYEDIDYVDKDLPLQWNTRYLADIEYLMIKGYVKNIC
jgi:N-acetylglutamate synthase-like GNAT family acetyltransferase